MKELDVFIHGETMNLCIPTEEFARESNWYSWFNVPSITRHLEQGMFPNTPEDQVKFFLAQKSNRLLLIISNKKEYLGIVSLSHIDLIKKKCHIAIVVNLSLDKKMSPFISLEAMARITEHAFNVLGVNRIEAGQHEWSASFQQRLELIGYKLEGIHKNKFIKGHEIADSFTISCIYEDFQTLVSNRGGLWDSLQKMKVRIKQLPKNHSFAIRMREFFQNERNDYYRKIFSL